MSELSLLAGRLHTPTVLKGLFRRHREAATNAKVRKSLSGRFLLHSQFPLGFSLRGSFHPIYNVLSVRGIQPGKISSGNTGNQCFSFRLSLGRHIGAVRDRVVLARIDVEVDGQQRQNAVD